jgi:TolB protein
MRQLVIVIILSCFFMGIVGSSCASNPTPLTDQPFSPTGTVLSLKSPTPTPLGSGGDLIAYVNSNVVDHQAIENIYLIRTDGSDRKNVTNNEDGNVRFMAPAFSPDGKKLVYTRLERVGGMALDGTFMKSELFILNLSDGSVQKISPTSNLNGTEDVSDKIMDNYAAWSPDGTEIAFSSNRRTYGYDNEIFVIDLTTDKISQVTNTQGANVHPTWSPDGKKLCFMSSRNNAWDLFTQDLETGELLQLTRDSAMASFPQWSPQGDKIIFSSDVDGNMDLYTIEPNGENLVRLTQNPGIDEMASWSQDGKWIVFQSDRDGDNDLYMMNLDDLETRNITQDEDQDESMANWAP